MGKDSGIEWCHHTFNVAWGCTKVSEACASCYAETWARRYGVGWGPNAERRVFGDQHWNQPIAWNRAAERLGERHRVFCSSMCDVFEDHPVIDAEREGKLWKLIDATPHLDWLLLTKRPERMAEIIGSQGIIRPNVWVGTTVENQRWADERLYHLRGTPARIRFVSVEPMLGPIDLKLCLIEVPVHREHWPTERVRNFWVICGGESGHDARPMHPDWPRSVRDQCIASNVPFHFKQWGEWHPCNNPEPHTYGPKERRIDASGRDVTEENGLWDEGDASMLRVGKKVAGRILDGRTWDELPTHAPVER